MKVWAFDENRADFVDAAPERMNADATGYYIIRRGDDVLVREHLSRGCQRSKNGKAGIGSFISGYSCWRYDRDLEAGSAWPFA